MSVTFTIETIPTGTFLLEGGCCWDATDPAQVSRAISGGAPLASYEEAVAALVAHREACEDCGLYGCHVVPVMDADVEGVNLANTNAATVLAALGYDTADLCGSASSEDFLGRVTLALATLDTALGLDDSGVAAVETSGSGRATVVECGLPAGYFTRTLGNLVHLATTAHILGRDICWS